MAADSQRSIEATRYASPPRGSMCLAPGDNPSQTCVSLGAIFAAVGYSLLVHLELYDADANTKEGLFYFILFLLLLLLLYIRRYILALFDSCDLKR